MPNRDPPQRVAFERPLPAQMMAIDGTWQRPCTIKDISQDGATLLAEASIEGLALKEFFLLLSSTGLAYRRCQFEGVNGADILVSFLRPNDRCKKMTRDLEQFVR
ncbi:PilZ domain-containing protein [Bradyrhizobium commune]